MFLARQGNITDYMNYRQLNTEEYDDFARRILYEDNHLMVVYKKVGEIVQGDKTGDECLAESYKAFIAQRNSKPGKVYVGIPHRLDRPVCGLCILCKTSKAMERMSAMFREGTVGKKYLALCCARPEPEEGELKNWLWRNEKQNKTYALPEDCSPDVRERRSAKFAHLRYRCLASTERYHIVEVELLTGRHHQIRCQLASRGWPIKGDLKYGAPRSNPDGGICLQSHEISFIHPVQHTEVHILAPLPHDWKGVQEALNAA